MKNALIKHIIKWGTNWSIQSRDHDARQLNWIILIRLPYSYGCPLVWFVVILPSEIVKLHLWWNASPNAAPTAWSSMSKHPCKSLIELMQQQTEAWDKRGPRQLQLLTAPHTKPSRHVNTCATESNGWAWPSRAGLCSALHKPVQPVCPLLVGRWFCCFCCLLLMLNRTRYGVGCFES